MNLSRGTGSCASRVKYRPDSNHFFGSTASCRGCLHPPPLVRILPRRSRPGRFAGARIRPVGPGQGQGQSMPEQPMMGRSHDLHDRTDRNSSSEEKEGGLSKSRAVRPIPGQGGKGGGCPDLPVQSARHERGTSRSSRRRRGRDVAEALKKAEAKVAAVKARREASNSERVNTTSECEFTR